MPVSARPLSVDVVCSPLPGGGERSLLELLDVERARLDLRFVVLGTGQFEGALRERGWSVDVQPTPPRLVHFVATAARLAARWRRTAPDIVLANGVKAAAIALPAARLAGVRSAWFKRDFSYDETLVRPLAHLADLLLAVSEEVAEATRRADAVVIPPPRPVGTLAKAEARVILEQLGVPRDAHPVIGVIGRLVTYKGVDDVIEALALPDGSDWWLGVIELDDPSEPGEHARLEELARQRGVRDRVVFLGSVDRAAPLMSAFDVVAVTSKTVARGFGREGSSRVVTEAMYAGVPVIATPGGGATNRLGGAGILVPPGSPDRIAQALAQLADARAREIMGQAGRRIAEAEPTAEECAERLVGALATAAGRPGAALEREVPISIVTTVLNEGAAVETLLDALIPQLGRRDELVVVDGGSSDDTAMCVKVRATRDDRVRLLEARGTNISAGRNRGIAIARHQYVACTDAGCEPWPGWLSAFRRAFAERDPAALITGVYEVASADVFGAAMAVACYPEVGEARRPTLLVRAYGALFGRTFDPSMPTGRSIGFSRDVWQTVGGFPEDLPTGEDVSFGRRVAGTGRCCILDLDAGVVWHQRESLSETMRMYFSYGLGGAVSADGRIVGRDLVRAVAYPAGVFALLRGRRGARLLASTGAAAYLSLPLVRACRRPRPLLVASLVPTALAVKDIAKAAGCVVGLARACRRPRVS
jgi:glycosyltransferase involved in cell wall biosynthesis